MPVWSATSAKRKPWPCAPCLSYQRTVKLAPDGKSVQIAQDVKLKCERISAAEYQTYRGHADAIARILDDELVLGAGKSTAKAPPVKAQQAK